MSALLELIEGKLDDLSMNLIGLDADGVSAAADLLQAVRDVEDLVGAHSEHERLRRACVHLLQLAPSVDKAALVNQLRGFVKSAQNYLLHPSSASFPHEQPDRPEVDWEWHDALDSEFLAEFIEKYLSLIDEFESRIIEFQFSEGASAGEDSEEYRESVSLLESDLKSFLHTLKGDAGSIGLCGLSKVVHYVEDVLGERGVVALTEALLSLKEWLSAVLKDYARCEATSVSPKEFAAQLAAVLGETPPAQPDSAETAILHDHPQANVSLLQELLQSSEFQALIEAGDQTELSVELQIVAERADAVTLLPRQEAPQQQAPSGSGVNEDLLAELMKDPEYAALLAADSAVSPVEVLIEETQIRSVAEGQGYAIGGDVDLLVEFVVEAEDHIGAIESTILSSEGPSEREDIDTIFRGIHSIKGASLYFKLQEIAETSHITENLLDEVRGGQRVFDQRLSALVLEYVDLMRMLLAQAREASRTGAHLTWNAQTFDFLDKLEAYTKGLPADSPKATEQRQENTMTRDDRRDEPVDSEDSAPIDSSVRAESSGAFAGADEKREKLEIKTFVKVETKRLDSLIEAIGEMVIYSSMLIQNCRKLLPDNELIASTSHQVEKFSRDLQTLGMSMRLIPIKSLFQKMSRIVWDLGKKIGKDIQFTMSGEDTELDRTIIDKLADPLMHMVRNAIDHGIEKPDDRVKAGKPRQGTVHLAAYHSGGSIHIQIRDDGRGLNPKRITEKAIEQGLITSAEGMTESELYELILMPGFSTAAQVTDISGRGVGMDVVKRNIESMRGRIRIESVLGKGSTFTIELPLTLAIIDGIEVGVGNQSYIVPTLSVVEFMKPQKQMITKTLDKGETFHFRGQFLPVYRLSHLFDVEPKYIRPEDATFVVVEANGEQAALMVDEILGTYSTVIKSLGEMFDEGQGFAGCAILSSGKVALILDTRSLLKLARTDYNHARVQKQCLTLEAERSKVKAEPGALLDGRHTPSSSSTALH